MSLSAASRLPGKAPLHCVTVRAPSAGRHRVPEVLPFDFSKGHIFDDAATSAALAADWRIGHFNERLQPSAWCAIVLVNSSIRRANEALLAVLGTPVVHVPDLCITQRPVAPELKGRIRRLADQHGRPPCEYITVNDPPHLTRELTVWLAIRDPRTDAARKHAPLIRAIELAVDAIYKLLEAAERRRHDTSELAHAFDILRVIGDALDRSSKSSDPDSSAIRDLASAAWSYLKKVAVMLATTVTIAQLPSTAAYYTDDASTPGASNIQHLTVPFGADGLEALCSSALTRCEVVIHTAATTSGG